MSCQPPMPHSSCAIHVRSKRKASDRLGHVSSNSGLADDPHQMLQMHSLSPLQLADRHRLVSCRSRVGMPTPSPPQQTATLDHVEAVPSLYRPSPPCLSWPMRFDASAVLHLPLHTQPPPPQLGPPPKVTSNPGHRRICTNHVVVPYRKCPSMRSSGRRPIKRRPKPQQASGTDDTTV